MLDRNTWNHTAVYKLLDKNTKYYKTVCKLFVLDKNTWNHTTIYKLLDKNTRYYKTVCVVEQ